MTEATRGVHSAHHLLAAASGGDPTLSTAAIGLFTLVSTVAIMYFIARGPRDRD